MRTLTFSKSLPAALLALVALQFYPRSAHAAAGQSLNVTNHSTAFFNGDNIWEYIFVQQLSTINQQSGTITLNQALHVGWSDGFGFYNISGGTLNILGNDGLLAGVIGGVFTQSGDSTVTARQVLVGQDVAYAGRYDMSSGTMATQTVFVSGLGTYTQNGGNATASTEFHSRGEVRLNGGTLSIGTTERASGGGTAYLNGGTLRALGSDANFAIGLGGSVLVQTGGAVIDTQNFSVTLPGSLQHDSTAGAPAIDGGLTKNGSGFLSVTGANTYTGPTIINNGGVFIRGAGTLGSGNIFIGGTSFAPNRLTSDTAATLTLSQNISGGGQFLKQNSGTTILTGANTYTGGTLLSAGTLQIGTASALGSGGLFLVGGRLQVTAGVSLANAVPVLGFATLDSNGHAFNLSGPMTVGEDGGGVTITGGGAVTFSGTTDNSGLNASVSAGTLVLAKNSSAGVHAIGGGLTIHSGSAQINGGLGGDQIFDGAGVTINGGTFNLNGATETIRVLNGALGSFITNNNLATPSTLTVNNGGTYSGGFGSSGGSMNLVVPGGSSITLGGTANNSSLSAQVNGGTLVLGKTSSGGVHAIGAGLTIPTGGTLQLAGSGGDQIADGSLVTFSGGTFNLNGRAETIGALAGASGSITNAGTVVAALTVSGGGSFGGTIANGAGPVGLSKTGTNTLTLSGANTFTGGTTVQQGVLALNNANTAVTPTGSGPVQISNGATLTGIGAVGGALTLADGATLSISTGITAKGNVTLGDNTGTPATAAFAVGGGSNSPMLTLATGVSLNLTHAMLTVDFPESLGAATEVTYLLVNNVGSSAILGTFESIVASLPVGEGYSLDYAFAGTALNGTGNGNDLAITIHTVPEPGTASLLVAAGVCAWAMTGRRRPARMNG